MISVSPDGRIIEASPDVVVRFVEHDETRGPSEQQAWNFRGSLTVKKMLRNGGATTGNMLSVGGRPH